VDAGPHDAEQRPARAVPATTQGLQRKKKAQARRSNGFGSQPLQEHPQVKISVKKIIIANGFSLHSTFTILITASICRFPTTLVLVLRFAGLLLVCQQQRWSILVHGQVAFCTACPERPRRAGRRSRHGTSADLVISCRVRPTANDAR
jgi:hypothetical protein